MCGASFCGDLPWLDLPLLCPAEEADACPIACRTPCGIHGWHVREASSHGGGGEVFGDRGCVNYEKEWLLEEVEDEVKSGRKRKIKIFN